MCYRQLFGRGATCPCLGLLMDATTTKVARSTRETATFIFMSCFPCATGYFCDRGVHGQIETRACGATTEKVARSTRETTHKSESSSFPCATDYFSGRGATRSATITKVARSTRETAHENKSSCFPGATGYFCDRGVHGQTETRA